LSESTPRNGQQSIRWCLAAGCLERLQAGVEPVEDGRPLAENRIDLDQFRMRRDQAADAFPGDGQFLERPVVLIEREHAVVRFAQRLAMDRRQVRLRIEVDQQRRRGIPRQRGGEIERRGGLADAAFLVENRHPHCRILHRPTLYRAKFFT
jgi:hypothetical protein